MSVDWEAYAKGIEKQIAELREYLTPLEAGEMTLGERQAGGPWRDVTQDAIDREKKIIATYESILKDIRTNRIK